ncbi:DUF7210 family protein [Xenorhabdus anantnagensis]|uniref:DUF7210 domain-containing protein n=1 Tax=Xenorhabdus anantnagensis TaxID=3025875 RepID=A0ABT5LY31_9GAMM|nr:hypothetical protein [Xenorhabdus anantnagensis]MDC9598733.1 hypothetical protein [Xenorhabdus anantnagensis]
MAKKPQQELGELPPELQTDPSEDITPKKGEKIPFEESDNEPAAHEAAPELVVVKGNTVRHNGVDYPENTVIDLQGDEAERLIQLGVVMRLDDLRAQLLSGNSQGV